jgi:aminoglycoside phosphotransferase family enzyme/predicted kinase
VNSELIQALTHASVYPHECSEIEVIETHISWIILTGKYAYKIKKPVDFGFLNFTSLAHRKLYCEAELTLNARSAPDLYLGLIEICGSRQSPSINGEGPAIEYAIKMNQFGKGHLFKELHLAGQLTFEHIDALAEQVSEFHSDVKTAEKLSAYGTPRQVYGPMQQNFDQIRDLTSDKQQLKQLEQLEVWTKSTFERLTPLLMIRKEKGFVRECHGDMHMGNITLFKDRVTLFDCIEFNEDFRWIDIISDIAFLVMDFEAHDLPHYANRFLNLYLEYTGDYAGLKLLSFYKAYRAVVRAKIALLSRLSPDISDAQKEQFMQQYEHYINQAESYSALPNRFVLIMNGVSGTGKSTIALRLVDRMGSIRIRSDVERKRLYGIAANEHPSQTEAVLIYNENATQKTYSILTTLCAEILDSGLSVIIDATNLRQWQRDVIQVVANERGVPVCIAFCESSISVIQEWIQKRSIEGGDPSDADLNVVFKQIKTLEPLNEEELKQTFTIHSSILEETNMLVSRIKKHLR